MSYDSDQECMVNDSICETIDEPQIAATASGFSASSVSTSTSSSVYCHFGSTQTSNKVYLGAKKE